MRSGPDRNSSLPNDHTLQLERLFCYCSPAVLLVDNLANFIKLCPAFCPHPPLLPLHVQLLRVPGSNHHKSNGPIDLKKGNTVPQLASARPREVVRDFKTKLVYFSPLLKFQTQKEDPYHPESHPEGIFFGFDEVSTCLPARIGLATISLAPFLTDGHTERYDCCQTTTAGVRFVSPGAAHSFVWFLTL